MKKILTSLILVASGLAFAQVGINAGKTSEGDPHDLAPDAVFHVENVSGQNKGVLLPSVALMSDTDQTTTSAGTVTKGLMVWNNGTGGLSVAGYYYWNGDKWILTGNVEGGSNVANLYTADGTLSGDRTVNQDNHDITYTTGTGNFKIDGTSRLNGASYVNTTVVETGTSYTVKESDYYVSIASPDANTGGQFDVIVPQAAESNKGRVLIFSNRTGGTANLKLLDPSGNQIINGSEAEVIPIDRAEWIVSDGTKWFNLINY